MCGRFSGWPEAAFDVLLELDGDPPAEVREECRQRREQLVRQPMIALLHDLADADPQGGHLPSARHQGALKPHHRTCTPCATSAQVDAAKLAIEMSKRLGKKPGPEIEAIAGAQPLRSIKR